ncbi:MAG: hypothetical protein A3H70_00135 [Candidatus Komeilibacteria bacterium RIFCSPLOWO2_02_FULL_48_11]|uniref:Uncharacterized protein n=1 Tax=Candidatus Komeilibacteria bacterium RIFCSPLOWO2_02_FULL_48_11 TaxID=1798553 RepID=A0A1G2BSQ7_9BACT|nr:MAG: hypothetical protein A3H70_00135 [Candidatus Komeilibacteria bacterium RIFCSPLOWO2_02_FULL_48_11]
MASAGRQTQELIQRFANIRDNPYVFAAQGVLPVEAPEEKRLPHEEEIVREQRLTFFENDEAVRRLFKGDFEAYSQALDNPDLMINRLEERVHEIQADIEQQSAHQEDFADWWHDEFWGSEAEELDAEPFEGEVEPFDDELYQKAQKWARRLTEVGSERYESGQKDPDLYRVLVNVFLVPAKIVYAASDPLDEIDEEFEEVENEISLQGYTLCLTFLQRARESLSRLIKKRLAPVSEWRAGLLAADEIALELQGRMIELAKSLREG